MCAAGGIDWKTFLFKATGRVSRDDPHSERWCMRTLAFLARAIQTVNCWWQIELARLERRESCAATREAVSAGE